MGTHSKTSPSRNRKYSSFFSLDEDHSTKPHPNINWLSCHGYQLFSQWLVAELLLHFAAIATREHYDQFGSSSPTNLLILHFSASNFPKDLALHRNGTRTGDSSPRSSEKKTFPFLQSVSPQFVCYPAFTLPSLCPACSLPPSLFLCRKAPQLQTQVSMTWPPPPFGWTCSGLCVLPLKSLSSLDSGTKQRHGSAGKEVVRWRLESDLEQTDGGWKAALRCSHTPPLLFDQILLKSFFCSFSSQQTRQMPPCPPPSLPPPPPQFLETPESAART